MTGLGSVAEQNLGPGSDYLAKNKQKKKFFAEYTGCPKKTYVLGFLAITPLGEKEEK